MGRRANSKIHIKSFVVVMSIRANQATKWRVQMEFNFTLWKIQMMNRKKCSVLHLFRC